MKMEIRSNKQIFRLRQLESKMVKRNMNLIAET